MKNNTTDYIFKNKYNKTLPYGVEYYTGANGVLGLEFMGFPTIADAIKFVDENDLIFYKQR